MEIHKLNILGINVTTMNMEETISFIMKKIHEYPHTKTPSYIATLNSDFLVNTHSFLWNKVKNKELLRILRSCACVTPDGAPILLFGRLLGSALKERITGVDLIPKLAAALAKENRSIYLLGGEEKVVKMTSVILEALYPGLKIVGMATPKVYTTREALESCDYHDAILIEEINKACPDILFISFGNPKQEIWFDKNKNKLNVAVAIGVGGAYNLTSGAIRRAPLWMQKCGLEWLYRLYKEPKRLWKRYTFGAFQFICLFVPLWIFHSLNNLQFLIKNFICPQKLFDAKPLLFLSPTLSLEFLVLPHLLEKRSAELLLKNISESPYQEIILLDASELCHASLEGITGLTSILKLTHNKCERLFIYGIKADLKLLLKLHRVWDIVEPYAVDSIAELLGRLPRNKHIQMPSYSIYEHALFESIQQHEDKVCITFLGNMQNNFDYENYLHKIAPMVNAKNCTCNLRFCTSIENSGFTFLLKLKSLVNERGGEFSIEKASKDLRHQFHLAKVDSLLATKGN